ncbi:MAG: C39 family peptidase [Anaerolineae bacterium]|nr:C39 family peptidase [Anaerolineae bacterium]
MNRKKASISSVVLALIVMILVLLQDNGLAQEGHIYTVNPTDYVWGSTPPTAGIIKARFTPDNANHNISVSVRKCDDSNFSKSGQAYILVDQMRNYTYNREPTGYRCGITPPTQGIVEFRLSPDSTSRTLRACVQKCDNNSSFSKDGTIKITVDGTVEWGPVSYNQGDETICFDIDPVWERGIVGRHTYQAQVFPQGQDYPILSGIVNAWEEYDYALYKWGPFNYYSNTPELVVSIDPVDDHALVGTHTYQVHFFPIGQADPIRSGIITARDALPDTTPPTATIISPANGSTLDPIALLAKVDAIAQDNPGGSGVKQADFYVWYDGGQARHLGADSNAPYSASWHMPTNLVHPQQIQFAVTATDNSDNVSELLPSSYSVVNFYGHRYEGLELNWVPSDRRVYLNQRSLRTRPDCGRPRSPKDKCSGDYQCGVASATMVLAMNDLIAKDYTTLNNKAYELYSITIPGNTSPNAPSELTTKLAAHGMAVELETLGADAAWQRIKEEVDARRPVIIHVGPGKGFYNGHFFVAVGYQRRGDIRELIVYDPYGEWRGSDTNWNMNTTDPGDHQGLWKYYDFDVVWTDYMITARVENAHRSVLSEMPDTPPDLMSTEPENPGSYIEEAISDVYRGFLPLLNKR